MRRGFSMLTAIAVIVIIASIGAFILSLSGKMISETTTQFEREQAMLLAKSYTEYAIMAVTANEQNSSNCLNSISSNIGGFYQVNVNISYIGRDISSSCSNILSTDVNTTHSPLSIIIDVDVKYQNPDDPRAAAPWVTFHKRTLQKI